MHDILKATVKRLVKKFLGRDARVSYSQNAEDLLMRKLARGSKNKIYVDVGGFHPITYSNTYGFYKTGAWRGLIVEPNPALASLYRTTRPRDIVVQCGVSETASNVPYFMFADGAYNTFDRATAQNSQNHGQKLVATSTCPVRPLRDILHEHHITAFDVLSIDVEGLDLEVLRSHDWSILPRVIAIEVHDFDFDSPNSSESYRFLKEKGYRLASVALFTLLFVLD